MATSTASIFTYPRFQALSNEGNPLAGGQLFTYQAGTLIPQATYTDSTLTVPNTNPIILDAFGTAAIWLGQNAYKFNLLDVNSVQQANFPIDNISGYGSNLAAALASTTSASLGQGMIGFNPALSYPVGTLPGDLAMSGGAALVGEIQPWNGAVASTQAVKNAQVADLADFGTVDTTGATDMSALITKAIASFGYISGNTYFGNVINLPAGLIKCNFSIATGSITIRGKGKNATQLTPATNNPVISIGSLSGPCQDIHIEEIGFTNASGIATGTTPAISSIGTTQINDNHVFRHVLITGYPYGLSILGRSILAQFEGVEILNSTTYGFYVVPCAAGVVNHLKFTNCRSYVSGSHGVYINMATNNPGGTILGVNFDHCDFEGAGCTGNVSTPNTNPGSAGIWANGVEGLTFSGECYFENNGLGASDSKGANIRITGSYAMWFDIQNCLMWASQNGIYVDAQFSIGYIGQCRLNGNTYYSIVTTGLNQISNVVIGPNYDGGAHSIAIDAFGCTRVKFLAAPDTARTVNVTLADAMDVTGQELMYAENSAPITLSTLLNGEIGQEITVFLGSAPVTFTHGGVSANGFFMPGQVTQVVPAYSVIKFVRVQYRAWLCVGIAAGPRSLLVGNGVATANTIAPNLDICHIVNTGAISLITIPYAGWTGQVTLIPDAAWTLATGSVQSGLNYPIALSSTAVVGKAMVMTFDSAKWYPSY